MFWTRAEKTTSTNHNKDKTSSKKLQDDLNYINKISYNFLQCKEEKKCLYSSHDLIKKVPISSLRVYDTLP